jgi:hypothetical protein
MCRQASAALDTQRWRPFRHGVLRGCHKISESASTAYKMTFATILSCHVVVRSPLLVL